MKARRLEPIDPLAERGDERGQVAEQPRSPYLTAREAIVYLRLHSQSALYRLIREHRLPTCRRGRLYLFDTRELDAWVRGFGSALEMARALSPRKRIAS